MRRGSHQGLVGYALGLIGALTVVAALAPAAVASARAPSLRLFAVEHRVSLTQAALRAGEFDLGSWVSSTGGAFQLDVRRPGYGPWIAEQIATGAALRLVPRKLVAPEQGFLGFLSIRFIDSRGRFAGQRVITFCPSGESARVNDTGPLNQTYPAGCGIDSYFPFVRGEVWGIDPGWALSATTETFPGSGPGLFFPGPPFGPVNPGSGIDLKPGRYTATVTITAPYRRLFAIPASDATVTLRVRATASPRTRGRTVVGSGQPVAVAQPAARDAADLPAVPTVSQPDPATTPNLVALPAWQIHIRRQSRRDLLTFNATVWNAGPAPFSIEGFRRANSNVMDAYEYFFDAAGNVVGRAPAGTMFYDNARGHHHWHLRQLASYTLTGPSGQVVQSEKQSFCIAPSDPVDLTVPNAAMTPAAFQGVGFGGSVCDLYDPGAIWLREQLPVGWGDTYSQFVAGQAFDVTNLPNGRYRIEVRVNPLGELTETTTADDVAFRVIRLSGARGARKVSVAPWHGIRG